MLHRWLVSACLLSLLIGVAQPASAQPAPDENKQQDGKNDERRRRRDKTPDDKKPERQED